MISCALHEDCGVSTGGGWTKRSVEKLPKGLSGVTMYWLRKLQGLCILWRTQISSRTVRLHTKQLASLQWGHQEVPPKFNFASDVIDHWAGMEKAGK
ncbi:hypothetical protein VULLAG_LOCUS11335 [Vulpes lagopus]